VLGLVVTAALKRPGGTALIAIMAAGSLLFTPYAMDYDLGVALVPVVWMAACAGKNGWRPWEKIVTLLIYVLPLYARVAVIFTGIQPAPLVLLAFAVLVWRRAVDQGLAGIGSGGMSWQALWRLTTQTAPKQRSAA
jgi:hypothetical protein